MLTISTEAGRRLFGPKYIRCGARWAATWATNTAAQPSQHLMRSFHPRRPLQLPGVYCEALSGHE